MIIKVESIRDELYDIIQGEIFNPFINAEDLAKFIYLQDLLGEGNYEDLEFITNVMFKINEYTNDGFVVTANFEYIHITKEDFLLGDELYRADYNGRLFYISLEDYDLMPNDEKITVDYTYDIKKGTQIDG